MPYPDEEGRIQSKLEDFWISVADHQKQALSRNAAFMKGVAQLEMRLLDKMFGHKLISYEAFSVSLSLCLGTLAVSIAVYVLEESWRFNRGLRFNTNIRDQMLFSSGLLAFSIVLGAVSIFKRRSSSVVFKSPFIVAVIFIIRRFNFVVIVLESFSCDATFIVLTRKFLKRAELLNSFAPIPAIVIGNLLLAVIFLSPRKNRTPNAMVGPLGLEPRTYGL